MNSSFSLEDYLKELADIVNIDSGSHDPAGVARIAGFFEGRFSSLGWKTAIHRFHDGVGPCLEATNQVRDTYDILVVGHMDTVFPLGTAAERPFTIKGDRAYGPGVIDMKASLLSAWHALRLLDKAGALKDKSVCVAFNSDEEIGSCHSRQWLEELARKSRYALIIEPARANGALVLKRKGVGRYMLEFSGVAAHAGVDPEKGASAIHELGHWIAALAKMNNYAAGTTVNVGLVSGGTASNVVADRAYAEVDIRIIDMKEAEKIERLMRDLSAKPRTKGVTVKVAGGINRPPMNPSEKTLQLCQRVEDIGTDLEMNIKWATTGGGSDGNFCAALGVPTIDGLGPVGGGTHGVNEYLEVDSVQPRLNLLSALIAKL